MSNTAPNHLHIYRDRRGKHITLDGHELLLDRDDPMLITGMENQDEVTRVMLTLLAPKITIDPETEDQEPETATVDAPAPTLAEELRDIAGQAANIPNMADGDAVDQEAERIDSALTAAAARAEQIEQERDQALAEVERLTAERDREKTISKGWMEAHQKLAEHHAETLERDVQKGAESNAEAPNPADVPEGQAWVVEYHGDTLPALRRLDHPGDWYLVRANGTRGHVRSQDITLVSRLVPAPRQVTTREELYELPRRTVIRDKDGVVCERASLGGGWYSPESTTDQTPFIALPATVLWTPEVPA